MDTIPCPGCAMPRSADLVGIAPCPVCGLAGTEPRPAPPPEPAPPAPVTVEPPPPAAVPVHQSRRGVALGFAAGVVVGIVLVLSWQSASRREQVPTGGVARAAEPAPPVVVPPPPPPPQPEPAPKPAPPKKPVDHPKTAKSASTGLPLVLVAAGEFDMGSWDHESQRHADEHQHRVRITAPFYAGTYEVTQEEFRAVTGRSPSWFCRTGEGHAKVAGLVTDRFPVESVTWFDAVEFCNTLSGRDGFEPYYALDGATREHGSIVHAAVAVRGGSGYRLPTEAEWEYAARAGAKTRFHFGGENTGAEANVKAQLVPSGYGSAPKWRDLGRPTVIGSYPGNRWGLYDAHGNVAEWCHDRFDRQYYTTSPAADPKGPDGGPHRVVRGGSWLSLENNCRSASRYWQSPGEAKYTTGFRVARTP